MWSEYVDATNFISRSWPRASAVAERAWSAADVTDLADASDRLHELRCKLIKRGINAEPIVNGGRPSEQGSAQVIQYCDGEWDPHYTPPWSS
jgi:N-acetyl-beta-hexosaminidase